MGNSDQGQTKEPSREKAQTNEPSCETEARKFIADEVKRKLIKYVKRFTAVFGVANVAALVGMWFTIQNVAESAARTAAETPAQKATEKFSDLLIAYGSLENQRTSLDLQVSALKEEIKGTRAVLDQFNGTDSAKVAKLLKDLPAADRPLLQTVAAINDKADQALKLGITTRFDIQDRDPTLTSKSDEHTDSDALQFQVSEDVEGDRFRLHPQIPSGTKVLMAWAVPVQNVNELHLFYRFAAEKDPSDDTGVVLRASRVPHTSGGRLALKVYVLYGPRT